VVRLQRSFQFVGDSRSDQMKLQWIVHFQHYHYCNQFFIKEFCGYCIQTDECFHVFVKAPFRTEFTTWERVVFDRQRKRHCLEWNFGDVAQGDFQDYMKRKIPVLIKLFAVCPHVSQY
jgi:hypothetical protein